MARPFAVLIRGLPSTGKTTTAALLRDALEPSVRVSNDAVRYLAHPRDFTAFTLEASELACMDLALSYCDSGFVPIVDGVFEDVDFLASQALRFARRGRRLVTVSLVADVPELLHRNLARDPLQRMDEVRLHRLHSAFRPVGVSLGISGKLPEEVCDDVLDIIGTEREEAPPAEVEDGEVDLLFLRHGTPDHEGYSPETGLSAQGRAEALAAREAVRRFAPEVVCSSDFACAWETARIATAGLDVEVERSAALRDGAAGEVEAFFDALPARHGGKRVLVVGHGAPHSWLVARAVGAEPAAVPRLRWDTGCFSRFTLSAGWTRLESMNLAPGSVVRGRQLGAG
ncbi:putative phosphoglycerate mutase [Saccharothrix carnea]|uniref:UDP-N-acetylglucosamine kinase n=1 Tax=Saccharothrix carnea TaxID=1280637 RepID=A0A2P8I075_SACCR|nr:histidine phosphatase family protein [Saccharothrix carnea]PSL51845.1 putative phosphoglycerate mutase [Saccharothrix carnea]